MPASLPAWEIQLTIHLQLQTIDGITAGTLRCSCTKGTMVHLCPLGFEAYRVGDVTSLTILCTWSDLEWRCECRHYRRRGGEEKGSVSSERLLKMTSWVFLCQVVSPSPCSKRATSLLGKLVFTVDPTPVTLTSRTKYLNNRLTKIFPNSRRRNGCPLLREIIGCYAIFFSNRN